ncbi:MAG: hypothetical protein AABZ47_15315 [Planctomycetota bacterium]
MNESEYAKSTLIRDLFKTGRPFLITGILAAISVTIVSPWALVFAFIDAIPVGLILIAAIGIGSILLRLFDLSDFRFTLLSRGVMGRNEPELKAPSNPAQIRWVLFLSTALGFGALSLFVLLLGLAGLLDRRLWLGIIVVAFVAGLNELHRILVRIPLQKKESWQNAPCKSQETVGRYWWLLLIPFLVLGVLAATNAPGLIWSEEGFGYDVLEYHLQMPKEFATAGKISFAPHNVYANFPANTELLYLLSMILSGDSNSAATSANFIHLLFAILTVSTAWTIGAEWSKRCAILCALVAASCGWLTYLSGLAYVENAMLFFGLSAFAVLLKGVTVGASIHPSRDREGADVGRAPPAFFLKFPSLLPGLLAGFACGCKYPAVPMIALPLIPVTWLVTQDSLQKKFVAVGLFVVGTLLTFSPWLIKNYAFTGNPVFPLANHFFQAHPQGWGDEEQFRWDRGHSPKIEEQTLARRLELAWDHTLADPYQRFGPLIFLLAIGGLFFRKLFRVDVCLMITLLIQLAVWLFATHLYARFAVVMLIPLILLAGRSVLRVPSPDTGDTEQQPRPSHPAVTVKKAAFAAFIFLGLVWNFTFAARLHHKESLPGTGPNVFTDGQVPGFEYLGFINHNLPQDAKLLLIGDARPFYIERNVDYWVVFNRHPFVDQLVSTRSPDEIADWLHQQRYTHVLVHWPELQRLSQTYGLANGVTPARIEQVSKSLQPVQTFPCGPGHIDLFAVPVK